MQLRGNAVATSYYRCERMTIDQQADSLPCPLFHFEHKPLVKLVLPRVGHMRRHRNCNTRLRDVDPWRPCKRIRRHPEHGEQPECGNAALAGHVSD